MSNVSRIAIIPARGGSTRLKNKNVRLLMGKPLVAHTIAAAQKSNLFDRIILSTDNDTIAAVGTRMGVDIYRRPKKYASNTATVLQALLDLMVALEQYGDTYDVICQMLPTCPFRRTTDLSAAMNLLDTKTDSVIGMSTYDFPLPKSLRRTSRNFVKPAWPSSPFLSGKTRTQDQEVFFHDNGSFYVTWWNRMKQLKNFYKGKVKGVETPPLNSLDIDVETDFITAQLLLDYAVKKPRSTVGKALNEARKRFN